MDLIDRRQAIDALNDLITGATESGYEWIYKDDAYKALEQLPPAEPDIIYCKDCRKHNKKVGFDENFHTVWKEDACPLVSWRGKAQGHEFDYQFCAFGERRTE